MADFAPGAATWQIGRNTRILDSGLFGPSRKNMTSFTKPEVHNGLHGATATGNICRTFGDEV